MTFRPAPGTGALFKNDKTKDTQPDATGYVIAHRDIKAGEKLRLAAWTKDGNKGRFQSLKLTDWEERKREEPSGGGGYQAPLDDSIPFAPEWRV